MNKLNVLICLIFLYSCVETDRNKSVQSDQKTEKISVKVYELKFGTQNCLPCMDMIHTNLVNQHGVIEVCSFYEKNDKDGSRKQIVARVSLSQTTTVDDVINSLEKETSLMVKSFSSKIAFYE